MTDGAALYPSQRASCSPPGSAAVKSPISYVQAVNKRYKRRGPLFEGRFRSKWIDDIDYLLHLCRYIHLNPVRAGLVKSPEDWIFSNYRDFVGLRNNGLIDRKFIKKYFTTANDYCNFIAENVTSRNP